MYRMKCHHTGLAFCLFVTEKCEQPAVGDPAPQPINRTCIYYVCCTRGCTDIYQGMLVLGNIPLVISHWATHTHTHAGEAGRTRAQRPKNKLQLGYNKGSRKQKERGRPSSIWGV